MFSCHMSKLVKAYFVQVEAATIFLYIILYFVHIFCTSLNGNTYGTKYQFSGEKSAGVVKLAK